MNWKEEEKEHKNKLRATFPMSSNKPRIKGYEKSPHRSRMTSHLMSTSFRYKNTTVATLLKCMLEHGQSPRAISEVLRFGIEVVEDYLINTDESYRFNVESEALDFLRAHNLDPTTSGKNAKRITNSIITESSLFERGFQQVNQPTAQTAREASSHINQEDIDKAMSIFNEKIQAVPYHNPSIVSPNNKADVSDRVEATHSNQIQQAQVQQVQQVSVDLSSHLVLKADGSTFKVKQDRSKTGRKSVCIVCSKCKRNPSYVLLDFEPNEGQPVLADCCKNCEGVTPHFIVSSISAKNGFEPPTAPTAVSPDEMKRILQANPRTPTK